MRKFKTFWILFGLISVVSVSADTGDVTYNDNGTVTVEVDKVSVTILDEDYTRVEEKEYYVSTQTNADGLCKYLGYENGSYKLTHRWNFNLEANGLITGYSGPITLWRKSVSFDQDGNVNRMPGQGKKHKIHFSPLTITRVKAVMCIPDLIPNEISESDRFKALLANWEDEEDTVSIIIRPQYRLADELHYISPESNLHGVCKLFGFEKYKPGRYRDIDGNIHRALNIKRPFFSKSVVKLNAKTQPVETDRDAQKYIHEIRCE